MATWQDGFNPKVITDRIEKTKNINEDGKASFHGFAHTEHVSILLTMLCLNQEIPDIERRKIINLATFAAAASGTLTPESLRAEVTAHEKRYLATPKIRFRLVSSISLSLGATPLVLRIKDSQLCFGWKPNKTTSANRTNILVDAKSSITGDLPSFYTPVSALVSARTNNEAAAKALDQIDLIRGIWNLWKNRNSSIRISSGARSPVNSFILGPIHTLHSPSGMLATNAWWYEPSYRGPISVWQDGSHAAKMLEFTLRVRKLLRHLSYRDVIESALIRYTRALDSRDWNYAFLQLWSVIEMLTGTTANESHKTTVKRAAFIYKNSDYATQTLLHLRDYRNSAVHAGEETEHIEPLMYQAKNSAEGLIEFHLFHAGKFARLADAADFLGSPHALADVDNQIRKFQAVRKYITRNRRFRANGRSGLLSPHRRL